MYVDVPHLDCLLVAPPITVEGLDHVILKPKKFSGSIFNHFSGIIFPDWLELHPALSPCLFLKKGGVVCGVTPVTCELAETSVSDPRQLGYRSTKHYASFACDGISRCTLCQRCAPTGHDPSVNMRKSHMRKILLLSASLLALTCTAPLAGTITIGLQEDAGATQQFSGGSNFAITGASTTDFQVNNISAVMVPTLTLPSIFDSNALDVRQDSGAAHTLHVFITAQGLMSPAALADLIIYTNFTTTSLRGEWTVIETTLFERERHQLWHCSRLAGLRQ
jgi:hypothetical protein